MGRQLLKTIGRVLQALLAIALLIYLGRYIFFRWREVRGVGLSFNFPLLLGACFMLLIFYLLYSITWQRLLHWIGGDSITGRFTRVMLLRIFFTSFITRYLPAGTLWNVSGRIELLKREGLRRAIGFTSVLFEQIYLVSGTIFLAAASILFYPPDAFPEILLRYRVWLVAGGVLVCLLTLIMPDWILWGVSRIFQKPILETKDYRPSLLQRLEIFFRFVLANTAQGMAGVFVLMAVFPQLLDRLDLLPVFISAYPFSRFIGQIMAFLPGGIGIREGSFIYILGPLLPIETLVMAAALMRLISVLMELFILGAVTVLQQSRRFQSQT